MKVDQKRSTKRMNTIRATDVDPWRRDTLSALFWAVAVLVLTARAAWATALGWSAALSGPKSFVVVAEMPEQVIGLCFCFTAIAVSIAAVRLGLLRPYWLVVPPILLVLLVAQTLYLGFVDSCDAPGSGADVPTATYPI